MSVPLVIIALAVAYVLVMCCDPIRAYICARALKELSR